jgi:hypothetical protein
MSDPIVVIAFLWVLLLWTTVGTAIYRWGPGRMLAKTRCPEKNKTAQIVVLNAEGNFGELKPATVLQCSLFGAAPVECDCACLARL